MKDDDEMTDDEVLDYQLQKCEEDLDELTETLARGGCAHSIGPVFLEGRVYNYQHQVYMQSHLEELRRTSMRLSRHQDRVRERRRAAGQFKPPRRGQRRHRKQ